MAFRTIDEIKAFFETGDVPTQSQYADFIDSSFNHIAFISVPDSEMVASDVSPVLLIPSPGAGLIVQLVAPPIIVVIPDITPFNFGAGNSEIKYSNSDDMLFSVDNDRLDAVLVQRFQGVPQPNADVLVNDSIVFQGSANTGVGDTFVRFLMYFRIAEDV